MKQGILRQKKRKRLNALIRVEPPIQIGSSRMTSRGLVLKRYETPYGSIDVERQVFYVYLLMQNNYNNRLSWCET
jgi:hypothetical protein